MLATNSGADSRALEKRRIFDRAGDFGTSQPTHGLLEGSWTGSSSQGLEHHHMGTTLVVVRSPSADTSNTITNVRVSGVSYKLATEFGRFVTKIRSNDAISISELLQRRQKCAPVSQDLAARQRMLLARAGGGLTTTELAQRLNVPEQEVDQLRTAGRLLAVPDPDGPGSTYPAFQFEGPRVVPGLSEVLSDFAVKSPWTRLYVLIGEDPALDGRTPFEALKDGDLDMVREIVSGYGQQGGD